MPLAPPLGQSRRAGPTLATAASEADDTVPMEDHAKAMLAAGRALLRPIVDQVRRADETGDDALLPAPFAFQEAYNAFRLAQVMDPANAEAEKELKRIDVLMKTLMDETVVEDDAVASDSSMSATVVRGEELQDEDLDAAPAPRSDTDADVVIVGAGAAGIGQAVSLIHTFGLDASRVKILERGEAIGTSFRQWPEEMRFISPSFNQAGWTNSFDLNSVAHGSSPAFSLHAQHPTGKQYADYLDELARLAQLQVSTRTAVVKVEPVDGVFDVHVRAEAADGVHQDETIRAQYVVWAAGEFQYPRDSSACTECSMPGTELCTHNSRVRSWAKLPGDDYVLIGGYESGVDAAVNLAKAGKQATVLASTATWDVQSPEPSIELAPYTAARLREVTAPHFSPRPRLLAPLTVTRVEASEGGGFYVFAEKREVGEVVRSGPSLREPIVGEGFEPGGPASIVGDELVVHTSQPPVLCTGFEGSVAFGARHLFDLASDEEATGCLAGAPLLTREDESTKVPGVFLVGPTVSHGELSFCFIYKFRQRFGIVANAICRGLGMDTTAAVAECRETNMFLDDLTCCEGACGDVC